MIDRVRCACMRCRMRGLMWPAILITLGVLFLVAEYSNRYSFMDLWPILLIVIGAVKLIESTASTDGHASAEIRPQ
jgi:membrane-bound ClpP family serine protease